jgi:hypothetical protein
LLDVKFAPTELTIPIDQTNQNHFFKTVQPRTKYIMLSTKIVNTFLLTMMMMAAAASAHGDDEQLQASQLETSSARMNLSHSS